MASEGERSRDSTALAQVIIKSHVLGASKLVYRLKKTGNQSA